MIAPITVIQPKPAMSALIADGTVTHRRNGVAAVSYACRNRRAAGRRVIVP